MTINFGGWLGLSGDLAALPMASEEERAALAYARILDKPSSVAFKTPAGTVLTAQTVRLESDNSASQSESEAGRAPRRKLIIFGVRNHATVTDTNMAEGYRFVSGGDEYKVVDIIETLGEVQGIAEAIG